MDDVYLKNLKMFLAILSVVILSSLVILGLGETLIPLLLSFVLSYLFFPIIKKFELKGIKRHYAVVAVFLVIVIVAIGIGFLVLPRLISDTKMFIDELPENSSKAICKVEEIAVRLGYPLDINKESVTLYAKEHISELSGGIFKWFASWLKASLSGIAKWLIVIINIFMIPLFFFYVIDDYEKISVNIKSFIPKSLLPKFTHYFTLSNQVLSGYIRGQLMVALVLAVLYATGLVVVGLKFGLVIGALTGLLSIIPYVGFTLGLVTAIIISLANFSGIGLVVATLLIFVVIQILESLIITPKLVGDRVGLSSLATMLALIVGGNLFGVVGMFIAIPIAAILKTVLNDLKNEYQQ